MRSPWFRIDLLVSDRRPRRWSAALGLLIAAVFVAAPAAAQLSGVSYTLSPVYDVVRWDNDLGLKDTELYGGRVGMNFGRYLGLQGFYLFRDGVDSDVARLGFEDGQGAPLANREFDIRNYGADLVLSLSRGPIIPFIKGGGGVMRFEGDGIDPMNQINLRYGGGIRFGISQFQGEVFVEDSAFRIDRTRLGTAEHVAPPVPADPDAEDVRHNLSFGAGLTFFLGGSGGREETDLDRAIASRYQNGLRGLSIPIEPYIGRLDFNDDFGLDNQELIGVRTGIDLGRLVGLRAYYWRGMNDDFDDTEDVQSYGGEAQFNLNSGRGAVPYVTLGAGQLDFMSDFRDPAGRPREDKTMLILGGGVGFTVGNRVRLNASARDYILSGDRDPEDVTTTDELFSNWMFSAGFQFNLGGAGTSRKVSAEPMAPAAVMPEEPRSASADTMTASAAPARPDTVVIEKEIVEETAPKTITEDQLPPTRNYQGDRIIAIPVPTEGEIYIRYGRPGGVSIESQARSEEAPSAPADTAAAPAGASAAPVAPPAGPSEDELRSAIRQELEAAGLAKSQATDDMEQLEDRLSRRIDDRLDRIETQLQGMRTEAPRGEGSTVVVTGGEGSSGGGTRVEQKPYSWSPAAVKTYTGINFDDPTQGVIGAKVDMGPVTRNSSFNFLPELAVGFGGGATTVMAAGNFEVDFGDLGTKGDWSPHVGAGLGILNVNADGDNHSEGVINLYYGLTVDLGRWIAFIEHQGVDLFDRNRLLVGLRLAI